MGGYRADTLAAAGNPAISDGPPTRPDVEFELWRNAVRHAVLASASEYVNTRCVAELTVAGIDGAGEVVAQFIGGGKCLRSTFMYLGWLCGADPDQCALRAAASLELLHAFALLQDDVMDDSVLRRGRPSAHVQFADWHRERGLSGSSRRFGEAAAILLADLCLVWAEQMMRESGVGQRALERAWPRYDAMRVELAVGQLADVANDAGRPPTMQTVLDVARRKSGNYTVRRPLEIGAAMAGRDDVLSALGHYGTAIGEAFQLRDDILGVFGSASVTGKPSGDDLSEHKATSVVVAAYQMADMTIRRQLVELMNTEDVDSAAIARWRTLIVATGSVQWIEDAIADRVTKAHECIAMSHIDPSVQMALANMAAACTVRAM